MKKLLIAMTAVSALSVFAEDLSNTVGFEKLEGDEVDAQITIGTGTDPYWLSEDPDETGTVKAYATDEAPADAGDQYLAVENSKTLYRTAREPMLGVAQEVPIADGLVFDTLVKFTCRDTLDVPTLDEGAKIAVWAGYNGDSEEVDVPTNLYITAAAVNGGYELTPTNFLIDADIDFTAWHRVTIRADKGVSKDDVNQKLIGFKVWVDEKQVVADATDYAGKIDPSVLSDSAKTDFDSHQLFIGLAQDLDDAGLAALGFNGQGSVDNIGAFDNDNAPAFTKVAAGFTMTWNTEAIASLSIGGKPIDVSSGSFDVTEKEVVVTVGFNDGYFGDAQQTMNAGNTAIVAKDINFTVDGEPFEDIELAFAEAAEGCKTVVLNKDAEIAMGSAVSVETDMTFDLNGKMVTATVSDNEMFLVVADPVCTLNIIGDGLIKIIKGPDIKEEDFNGLVLIDGEDVSESRVNITPTENKTITLDSGFGNVALGQASIGATTKFLASANDKEVISEYAVTGTVVSEKDGYIVVQKEGGDEPTPVEPGKPTQVTAKDADEAISKVKFQTPAAVTEAGVDATKYEKLFEAKATEVESGTWEVSFVLTEKATAELQKEVDDAETILGAVVDGEGEATIKATPGIYYSVIESSDVTTIKATGYKMATGAELTLPLEQFEGSGFYQIRATVAAPTDCEPIVDAE